MEGPIRLQISVVILLLVFPTASFGSERYLVKPGDTLWSIAREQRGDPNHWNEIARLNNIRNPSELVAGSWIVLTGDSARKETSVSPEVPSPPKPLSTRIPPAVPPVPYEIEKPNLELLNLEPPATSDVILSLPLTLKEAVMIGYSQSPKIEMAREDISIADASIGITRADALPQLNASLDARRTESFKSVSALGLDERRATGAITLNQALFTFGRLSNAIKAGNAQEAAALARMAQTKAAVAFEVRAAFLDLLLASTREIVASEAQNVSVELLKTAIARENAGAGTRFDVTRAQAEFAGEKAALAEARAGVKIRKEVLAAAMGLPPSTRIEVTGELRTDLVPVSPGEAIEIALRERPDLAILRHQIEEAGYRVEVERARGRPSIDASASASYTKHDFITSSPFFQGTEESSGFIGVGVSIPIFSGFRVKESVRRERAAAQKLIHQYESAQIDAVKEVRRIYYDLQSALEIFQAREAGAIAARESLRIARLSFQEGLVSSLDVIDASLRYTETQNALLEAAYLYRLALADLVRAVGSEEVIVKG